MERKPWAEILLIILGTLLYLKGDKPFNDDYGVFVRERDASIEIQLKDGSFIQLSKDSDEWKNLTSKPFNV